LGEDRDAPDDFQAEADCPVIRVQRNGLDPIGGGECLLRTVEVGEHQQVELGDDTFGSIVRPAAAKRSSSLPSRATTRVSQSDTAGNPLIAVSAKASTGAAYSKRHCSARLAKNRRRSVCVIFGTICVAGWPSTNFHHLGRSLVSSHTDEP
jgi:hypothetical protein